MKQILLTLLFISIPFGAIAQSFSSGDKQVKLIELYTSEGCSSCPPADYYLSQLKKRPGVFTDFIPVAMHVGYWDYLGWKDPFADPRNVERQYTHKRQGNVKGVYTPGFLINGEEWHGGAHSLKDIEHAGKLDLHKKGPFVVIQYDSDHKADYIARVAIIGFDLTTEVKRGENRGKALSHDFVVLQQQTVELSKKDGVYQGLVEFADKDLPTTNIGLAGWVEIKGNQSPIQATGGYLTEQKLSQIPQMY